MPLREKGVNCLLLCYLVHQILAARAAQQLQWEPGLWRNPAQSSRSGRMERRRLFRWTELDLWKLRTRYFKQMVQGFWPRFLMYIYSVWVWCCSLFVWSVMKSLTLAVNWLWTNSVVYEHNHRFDTDVHVVL